MKSEKLRKKVDLTIAGTSIKPKYLSYLKRYASPNVHFKTKVSDSELARLYKDSDVYVTCDRFLFFGLPIAEAAFFQKPSIALNYAAASELIINKKTGFVCKNQKELENTIAALIRNKYLAKKLGLAAYKRAQEIFTWEKCTKQYLQLFK